MDQIIFRWRSSGPRKRSPRRGLSHVLLSMARRWICWIFPFAWTKRLFPLRHPLYRLLCPSLPLLAHFVLTFVIPASLTVLPFSIHAGLTIRRIDPAAGTSVDPTAAPFNNCPESLVGSSGESYD